jgi:hemerythrin-like domain-containing protein
MSEPLVPNVGHSLILVHRVVTRGLQVTIARSRALVEAGSADDVSRAGLADYVQSLATFLHAHHTVEDEIVFPLLRAYLPAAPYATWARQHQAMMPLINRVRELVPAIGSDNVVAVLQDVHRCAGRIEEGWQPHFKSEEEHLTPAGIAAVVPAADLAQLNERIGAFNREHLQPDYLLMPFTLHNLSGDDRAQLARALPTVVVNELVPGPWKEKWQPMAPYLLP